MTFLASRRGFLGGLLAAIAAPSIVHAGNIMPVRAFDPYYTRALIDYAISSDTLMLRIDRATFPLAVPRGVTSITLAEAYRFIPKALVEASLKPEPGQQMNIYRFLLPHEAMILQSHYPDRWD